MDGVLTGPTSSDWTRWSRECSSSLRPAPARAVAEFLGQRDVADLGMWSAAINAVGADIADQCESAWPHAAQTPVVVLLRQIGQLACEHPSASTLLGEALMVMIDATERQERSGTRYGTAGSRC